MQLNLGLSSFLWQIFKGVVIAVLITLVSVLIFAFVLSVANLPDKVIKPTNQFVKTLSVLFAVLFTAREGRFLIKGGLIGLLSAFFTVLLFAVIASLGVNFLTVLLDLAFGFLTGLISGAITGKILKWWKLALVISDELICKLKA